MIITPELLVRLRHVGSRQKAEKGSYDVGIGSFLRLRSIWSQKFRFLRDTQFCPETRNFSDTLKFQRSLLLKHLSKKGVLILAKKYIDVIYNFCIMHFS
jgi:hypothetical protein